MNIYFSLLNCGKKKQQHNKQKNKLSMNKNEDPLLIQEIPYMHSQKIRYFIIQFKWNVFNSMRNVPCAKQFIIYL